MLLPLFVLFLGAVDAQGPLPVTNCFVTCNFIVNTTLSYCSKVGAGQVNYTSCISPKDFNGDSTDGTLADARALNNSITMPRFSDDISCLNAQRRLLCALLFPKCTPAAAGAVVSQPVCYSTCVNFFVACNVALTTQCQFTQGVGPSDTCTGLAVPGATPAVALLVLLMLLAALLL